MNNLDNNIYTQYNEITNNILKNSYLNDIENNLYYENLQLYLPMNNSDSNLYTKSLIKTETNGYKQTKAVGFSANITTSLSASYDGTIYYHLTNDSSYNNNTLGIVWTQNWCYPNSSIFDDGKFMCPVNGLYKVYANIRFDNVSQFIRIIVSVNKNTSYVKQLHNSQGAINSNYEIINISGTIQLFKNDIVTIVFQVLNTATFEISEQSSFSIILINAN